MQQQTSEFLFRSLQAFRTDTRGTIAVFFAICSIPIAIAASIALDMSNASNMKAAIQTAADSAVLAGATRLAVGATDAEKEEAVLATFAANLSPVLENKIVGEPNVQINFPDKVVHLDVTVTTAALLSSLAKDEIGLRVAAAAGVSKGTPICIMALNPDAAQSLEIQGTADLMAKDCAVHVNSEDDQALYHNGNATGTAASFCVHGSHSGSNFTPPPKDNCAVEQDPLAYQFDQDWKDANVSDLPCTYSNLPQINTGAGVVTDLLPGVYCGGLTIKKGTVQLQQGGMYVFRDGPLHVQAHGQLKGTEVAVLFHGDSSTRLITQAGANVKTTARKSGKFKGLVFAQHPSSIPDKENLVIGGGQVEITGVLYFPKQAIKVTGGGDLGVNVAQFAIIADTIAIDGNGQVTLQVAGNPDDLPDLALANEVVHLIE